MRLYIIRHGETNWNKERRLQGHTDVPLNENGIELARITGEGMKDVPIDLCICGPLMRTRQTAEGVLTGRNVPFLIDDRIMEISFGDWEGENIFSSTRMTPGFMEKFHEDPLHCPAPPNGESFPDVLVRTKDFYDELIAKEEYQDRSILISTHGAASRCLLHNLFPESSDLWLGGVPPNCAVSTVDVTDGVGVLVELDRVYYDI